jgi:hypothetical protein
VEPGKTLEADEVAQVLQGLIMRRYYTTMNKDDSAIKALLEVAEELDLPVSHGQLDAPAVQALRAAEVSGKEIEKLPAREVWKQMLLHEVPQDSE